MPGPGTCPRTGRCRGCPGPAPFPPRKGRPGAARARTPAFRAVPAGDSPRATAWSATFPGGRTPWSSRWPRREGRGTRLLFLLILFRVRALGESFQERVHFSHDLQGGLGLRELRREFPVLLPEFLVLGLGRALPGASRLPFRDWRGRGTVTFPAPFRYVGTVDALAAEQPVPLLRGGRSLVLVEDAHLVLAGERPALRPRRPRPVWAGLVLILPAPGRSHVGNRHRHVW